ncbi:hypothetical protein [Sphingomonas qilianensis]|uniref:hypothetical protein n=1 Tax=Sphingomonas qilianensis TaxID=1736690 RepID=UPI0036D2E905
MKIYADRSAAPLGRRLGDARDGVDPALPAAPPPRHWLTIPAWLFAIGCLVGGSAAVARHLLDGMML